MNGRVLFSVDDILCLIEQGELPVSGERADGEYFSLFEKNRIK